MPLAAGTRIGVYEIASVIGAGGMGEVYRARDTRLDRDVAIKILPEVFAADPERFARFEREAKTLASLNHPHIAQIYGFEQAGPTSVLVMELVEGEDLAQRLVRGPMPLDDALPVALQIADGLEAAHASGIIHRDLKPANVKVRPDGMVKVLDFGLARGVGPAPEAAQTGTTPAMTVAGTILGTAAYMAPEQARGRPVDRRADIWAFGCLFYEILTGRRAFAGDDVPDTLARILRDEPAWDALPADTPAPIRRVLRRSLQKDPARRLRDIGDARAEIADAMDGTEDRPLVHPTPRPGRTVGFVIPAAAMLLLGALAGALGITVFRSTEPPSSFTMRRLTELPGPEVQPAISPDGRQLVYASAASGNMDVYLLRVGGDRAINLTAGSPADDSQPAFSPGGEQIAFRSERDGGGLFVMGATGESVRRVTSQGFDPAWSPDGRFLAFATEAVNDPYDRGRTSELWVVELATGEQRRLFAGDAVQPAWSPRGERIAFWTNLRGQRDIHTIAAAGGEPLAITADEATDWSPEWSPDGRWLYFSSDRGGSMNLWRVQVNPVTGATAGTAEAVTSSVRELGFARFAAAGDRLVVMAYERTSEVSLYAIDALATGPLRAATLLRLRSAKWCNPSPDGTWLACSTTGTPEDLVLLRTDGSELRRLTDDVHKDRVAKWSPDGRQLMFLSTRTGGWNHWSIRSDGSGLRQLSELGDANPGLWSPDGTEIIAGGRYLDVWRFASSNLATPESAGKPVRPPGVARFQPQGWSRSGTILVGAEADEHGELRNYGVWDLETDAYRSFAIETSGRAVGAIAGWLADSRHFIARSTAGVVVIHSVTGKSRVIAPCATRDFLGLSHDGRTLMVEHEVLDSDVWLLESR